MKEILFQIIFGSILTASMTFVFGQEPAPEPSGTPGGGTQRPQSQEPQPYERIVFPDYLIRP